MLRKLFCLGMLLLFVFALPALAQTPSPAQVRQAMDKAARSFRLIAVNGGYAGLYSLDLSERYGEAVYEKAAKNQIWVQPPGTPTVGGSCLRAYQATGDKQYLDAARDAGLALAWGQRKEGGWDHLVDVSHLDRNVKKPVKLSGRCALDDDITQGAITFLIELDAVLDEEWLTEAITMGLDWLRKAQFPNGAWPQWYPLIGSYHDYYTFNDNAMGDCIRVMLLAHERYGKPQYLESAKRCGDFIILSQVAAPQSGWAQQYSHDLKPAWARAFEPPGLSSAESAGNIRTLMTLYRYTGEKKYLDPIPKAIEWFERSKIGADLWARLYELETNRPIYGDRDNKVHYTLEEISEERRKGYSWQSSYGIPGVIRDYQELIRQGAPQKRAADTRPLSAAEREKRLAGLAPGVAEAISTLDAQGRWIEPDTKLISCRLYNRNMGRLIEFLEMVK
ncbi:MAG: pectate lyase [Candidatus Latescibacterota bacterium]